MEVTTLKDLCDLMVLKQFKDCIPPEVATRIAEHGVKIVSEVAILADEYVLAHKLKGKKGKAKTVSQPAIVKLLVTLLNFLGLSLQG